MHKFLYLIIIKYRIKTKYAIKSMSITRGIRNTAKCFLVLTLYTDNVDVSLVFLYINQVSMVLMVPSIMPKAKKTVA